MKDVDVQHPLFGKALPCPDCAKVGQQRAAWLRSICRVPTRFVHVMLEDFRPGNDNRNVAPTISHLLKSREGTHWLTLWGETGVGKTLLLCAAVNEAVEADRIGVYTTMADLLDHLRRAYNPDNRIDGDKFWDTLLRADVLALDEVDRFNPTPWAKEKFFELVNARYNEPGLTLFATNKPAVLGAGVLDDQPGYFESRLSQGLSLEIKGVDRRPIYAEVQEVASHA